VKQRVSIFAAAAFSLIISLFAAIYVFSFLGRKTEFGRRFPIPLVTPTPDRYPLMGAVAIPSPSPSPKPTPAREVMGDVTVGKVVPSPSTSSSSL
jgi:hypothetical protein